MICPKCRSKNQLGNFCGECGNQLKEKCPECGNMEPIGRKVCETELEEAKQARKEYLKNKVGNWRENLGIFGGAYIFLPIAISFSVLVVKKFNINFNNISGYQFACMVIFSSIVIILAYFLLIFLGYKKQKQAERKATQEFLQEYPEYAEILRMAEET